MTHSVDQADGLRRLLTAGRPRIVAVAGLCKSVGATTAAMNLAAAVARQGKPVLVLDEHAPASGSLCAAWGVAPAGTLADVVHARLPLERAAARPLARVQVLPGPADGAPAACNARALCPDGVIVIDAGLDAQGQLSPLARQADQVVVVMQPTAAAITATYAALKRLQFTHALQTFRFLVNRAASARDAQVVITNVVNTGSRFLAVSLRSVGWIIADERMRDAASLRQPVCEAFPDSPAASQFRQVAGALLEPPAGAERGGSGAGAAACAWPHAGAVRAAA